MRNKPKIITLEHTKTSKINKYSEDICVDVAGASLLPGFLVLAAQSRNILNVLLEHNKTLLTVTSQNVGELCLGTPCELLSAKCFPDHLVVAKNHNQLVPQPRAEHGTVFTGKITVVQVVNVAFQEGQIPDDWKAPWSRRQTSDLSHNLTKPDKCQYYKDHHQNDVRAARSIADSSDQIPHQPL